MLSGRSLGTSLPGRTAETTGQCLHTGRGLAGQVCMPNACPGSRRRGLAEPELGPSSTSLNCVTLGQSPEPRPQSHVTQR